MSTLLIAHPDVRLTAATAAVLRGEGHEVVEVGTGEDAVARAIDIDADVVLICSHLPDQEGREVASVLREAPGGRELGILAIGPEFWEPGVGGLFVRGAGVDGFVALPCRRSTLLAAVTAVLDRFRRRTPPPSETVTRRVDELFDRLGSADYYDLLGIERGADAGEVTEAFHLASASYHPDRHHIARQTTLYEHVSAVYKRMTEAYRVLADPAERARYDEGLAAGRLRLAPATEATWGAEDAAPVRDENALRFFELGQAAEQRGDARSARMNYAFALTYEPDNAALLQSLARTEDALGVPADRRTQTQRFAAAKPEAPGPGSPKTEGPGDDEDRTATVPGRPQPAAEQTRTTTAELDYILDVEEGEGEERLTTRPPDLPGRLPRHVAVIMDGNGRWAVARGLPRLHGHEAGSEVVRTVTRACRRWGIPYLTLYAFSAQNWERPGEEVAGLMDLLARFIESEREELVETGVRVVTMGDLSRLPPAVRGPLVRLVVDTKESRSLTLCLALSYGGREELLSAARKVAEKAARGDLDPASLDEDSFRAFLDRPDLPDPDLVIRTSGEMRLSNFMLWQVAYAELWVTPTLWPDFGEPDLLQALKAYSSRERRFGNVEGSA